MAGGRIAEPPKRSRLLSWISGDVDDEPAAALGADAPLEALLLPSRDVRREMLRLQLLAEGMVVSETGEIELSPELQAQLAARAELAAVEAAAAAIPDPIPDASAAAVESTDTAAPTEPGQSVGSAEPAVPTSDAEPAVPTSDADLAAPTSEADPAPPDSEIRKAS